MPYIIAHTSDPALIPDLTVDDLTADYRAFIATNMREITAYRQYLDANMGVGEVFQIRDDTGTAWYMASHEISETGWTLFIAVPQSYVLDGIMRLMFNASIFWFPSIIFIVVLIGYVVSRVISRPLHKIGVFASEVSSGNIPLVSVANNAIAVYSNDEIGALARTLEYSYMQLNESRLKSNFLANISHEMKSPLGIMGGYAKLTKKQIEAGTVSEKTLNNLQTISDEALRLAELVNRMLRASVEMEGASSFACVAPQDIIGNAAALCEPIFTANKLTIHIEKDCPSVMANPDMITEVLVNLIGNANRHTGRTGKQLPQGATGPKSGIIELRAERTKAGMVTFSVRDNGEGILPDMLARVFIRGVSGAGSSGIGLSTSKETVENHGGEINIESAVGKGTLVTFTLPIYNKPEGSGAGVSPA
ncbi:MAG: HAMP domain-containing histidine kinase [Defluviitaleaceae bacterium]|nr:HAMP domain-containing histidine kinase [Defluviitaleaceae bacterium]